MKRDLISRLNEYEAGADRRASLPAYRPTLDPVDLPGSSIGGSLRAKPGGPEALGQKCTLEDADYIGYFGPQNAQNEQRAMLAPKLPGKLHYLHLISHCNRKGKALDLRYHDHGGRRMTDILYHLQRDPYLHALATDKPTNPFRGSGGSRAALRGAEQKGETLTNGETYALISKRLPRESKLESGCYEL